MNRSMPPGSVIPELAYRDVGEAAEWLCRVFGFRERLRIGDHRAQLVFGDGSMIVTRAANADAAPKSGHAVMVRVDDVDAHYRRAVENGADVLDAPQDYPYGERQYGARDIGGHSWTFSQSIFDSNPAEWGGQLMTDAA